MSKKKIIIIITCILILFIFNIMTIISNINTSDDYYKDISNKDTKYKIETILNKLTFSDEIKEEISANKFYKEFLSLNNHDYLIELCNYFNIADETLKNNGSSFVSEFNEGKSFETILYEFGGEEYQYFTNGYLLGNDKNDEYPKENVDNIYYSVLKKVSENKIDKAIEEINNILENYKLTKSYNLKLTNLYHDLQILNSESSLTDVEILETLYDPSVYTIKTMQLFTDDRYNVIESKDSPYLYSSVNITIKEVKMIDVSLNNDNYKDIYEKIYNLYVGKDITDNITISKITFTVTGETEEFIAYIATLNNKTCHFYTIEPKENKHYDSLQDIKYQNKNNEITNEVDNNGPLIRSKYYGL